MRHQRTPQELGFTRKNQPGLHKAINQVSDKRTFVRLKAVLLVSEGMNISEVAKLLDKSFQMIYCWVAAYLKQHHIEALDDTPRSGRPLSAPSITDKRILRELRRNPLLL